MNPQEVFCPNIDCPARGQQGKENIEIHSRSEKRYMCTVCSHTFSASKGTIFYRLRTDPLIVIQVITLLAYGCPMQAIVQAFGLDERTVKKWHARAGAHCQTFHEHMVETSQLDLQQVQADEIKVKMKGHSVWMAMAIMVSTQRSAHNFQVVRRIVQGLPDQVSALIHNSQGGGVINTAYIERFNATFRQRLASLSRRNRCPAQQKATLTAGMYIVSCFYNFCDHHHSLRLRL